MSVRIGIRQRALIAASTRKPSSRPGPRKDRPDVRLALSYDALKMNGTRDRQAISASCPARSVALASLSITHGPAMRTNGLPPPIEMSPSVSAGTGDIIGGGMPETGQDGWKGPLPPIQPVLCAQRDARRVRRLGVAGRLVLMRRADERGKQRMRPRRLRLELGMELHRQVPRMARQLGDLHELSVW